MNYETNENMKFRSRQYRVMKLVGMKEESRNVINSGKELRLSGSYLNIICWLSYLSLQLTYQINGIRKRVFYKNVKTLPKT